MSQEDGGFVEWEFDRYDQARGFRPVKLTAEEKTKVAALCLMGMDEHLPCGSFWYRYRGGQQMFWLNGRNVAPKHVAFKTDPADIMKAMEESCYKKMVDL